MAAIETLLENAVDKYFDKFELFVLKNIFTIPDDVPVTLPHYEVKRIKTYITISF